MSERVKVVIVGGVACGPKTAARLVRLLPTAEVTVVEKGPIASYGACGLPYFVAGEFHDVGELVQTPAGIARTPAFFEAAKGFRLRTRTEAVRIERGRKRVVVRDLETGTEEELPYDKLVLATGGQPVRPPIAGLDLRHVWHMTHPDDARTLVEAIEAQGFRRIVLVGAGLINIEMAEALVTRGLQVTLVEMAGQVLPGILDEDMAALLARHLRQKGVVLVLGEAATELVGDGNGAGHGAGTAESPGAKVAAVRTAQRTVEADAVVVAVGTRPNMRLAAEAGLDCRGGIVVDENNRTSDPDIYAGGDCVVNRHLDPAIGELLYVPLGSTANKQGRVIANHIAGRPTPFRGIAGTGVVRAFEMTAGRTGLTEKQARAMGLDVETTTWAGPDRPHYMSEARPIVIKMLAARADRRLLGVQVVGAGDGAKRLDVAAAVIAHRGTLDSLADIDFAYAPPFSPPIDPLATCAHVLMNKLDGIARGVPAAEARRRAVEGKAILLDTRTPGEVAQLGLPHDVVHIPLGALRGRLHELPRDREILAFCKVSMRGYEAQRILQAAGFENVGFVEGGLAGWPFEFRT